MIRICSFLFLLLCAQFSLLKAQPYPFQNSDLPIEERVNDLVGRMTLEEKIGQMMNAAPAIERLNVPAYDWWNECLHGVARAGKATVFPQAIGMAATFDTDAMYKTAVIISDEGRAKYHKAISQGIHTRYHGLTFWTPNINIFRDPRWGRGQETYGEDPYLTGELGLAFVKGLQGDDPKYLKAVATAKHYAVHSGPEYNRHTFDVSPPLRDVWGTYLPAFEKVIKEGNVQSVMCAYNRFEGSPCCGSDELMLDILRNQWGFQGYVVSDCGAIDNFYRTHKTSPDAEAASAEAVIAGTDLECGGSYHALIEAIQRGYINENQIDIAVKRLFTSRMKLGMFDPDDKVPYSKIPFSVVESAENRKQSLEMARKSIVLLKNDNHTLPFKEDIKTIAIIGPNADYPVCLLANYKGSPSYIITPLEGIRKKAGNKIKIIYDQGVGFTNDTISTPADINKWLKIDDKNGFKAEYFNNKDLAGHPVLVQYEKEINCWGAGQHQIAGKINATTLSARWTSILTPAKDEIICFEMTSGDSGFRLFIDDVQVMDRFRGQESRVEHYQFQAEAGKSYRIRFEFSQDCEGAGVSLTTVKREKSNTRALIEKIAPADVIVFVGGISPALEGEDMPVYIPGFNKGDRTSINLPEVQTELLKQLAATGKPVVFVMLTGSALAIYWEKENIPAIINAWYGGQEAGTALADVLFGDYNPAGRLPVTFYANDKDLPPYEDYSMNERTYRYFTGKPLFEFGYGLSYTQFEYSELTVPEKINTNENVRVKVTVKNTGDLAGEEVIQLYVSHPDVRASSPIRSLQGFQRIFLKAGESKQVEFMLTPMQLSIIDGLAQRCIVQGRISISVGGRQPSDEAITNKSVQKTMVELTVKKYDSYNRLSQKLTE